MIKPISVLISIVVFYLCCAFVMWDMTPDFGELNTVDRVVTLAALAIFLVTGLIVGCELEEKWEE